MKKLALFALAMFGFMQASQANHVVFESSKADQTSQFCINAVTGKQSLSEVAEIVGLEEASLDRNIKCNGVGINTFVNKYAPKNVLKKATVTKNNFALAAEHNSENAQLCVIAATGDIDKLERLIRSEGMNVKYFVKHQKCNSMSVVDFVNKYGSHQAASQLESRL